MQGVPVFETFDDAYVACLRSVCESYEYTNAPRGLPSRERLNVSFLLTAPWERVPYLASRKTNIIFNFAHVLWILSGRDDLEMIAYYAPTFQRFSTDGRTLMGSAYGPRIFQRGDQGGPSQWDRITNVLAGDPDSKRAVIQLFDSAEPLGDDNIDVCCTLALQFLIRNGRLHATCFMRANNAFQGIVGDVFSNTFLQEFLATQLGLEMGCYAHHVGSMHIIDADLERTGRVLAEAAHRNAASPRFRFPSMPATTSWNDIRQVLVHEEALRQNTERLNTETVTQGSLPAYWQQVLLLFELHREIVHDQAIDPEVYDALIPAFQYLVRHKWKLVQSLSTSSSQPTSKSDDLDWRWWTVVLLKPDCVERGLVEDVLNMLREDICVVVQRTTTVSEAQIMSHYADLIEDPDLFAIDIRAELGRMYVGRQVVVALAEGREAAATVRRRLGHSDPARADPATIRGRFGVDSFARARMEGRLADSVVHSSDSPEDAEREFGIWFGSEHRGLLRAAADVRETRAHMGSEVL
jgi:thymidylate synthase